MAGLPSRKWEDHPARAQATGSHLMDIICQILSGILSRRQAPAGWNQPLVSTCKKNLGHGFNGGWKETRIRLREPICTGLCPSVPVQSIEVEVRNGFGRSYRRRFETHRRRPVWALRLCVCSKMSGKGNQEAEPLNLPPLSVPKKAIAPGLNPLLHFTGHQGLFAQTHFAQPWRQQLQVHKHGAKYLPHCTKAKAPWPPLTTIRRSWSS